MMRRLTILCAAMFMPVIGAAQGVETSPMADVEKLPITGMFKVTDSEGKVTYLSDDNRFVFVGKMYDLRTGDTLDVGASGSKKLNLERNGVSLGKISFPIGPRLSEQTLIIAPECEDCKQLLSAALTKHPDDLNIVLLSSSTPGLNQNRLVWCAKDQAKALKQVYLEGIRPSDGELNNDCNQFGLMLAEQAAMLFGIGQLPMFVDKNENGHTGEAAITAVLQ